MSNIIEGPWPSEEEREREEIKLLPYPPMHDHFPPRMALDGLSRIMDGLMRLESLDASNPDVLPSLTTIDGALAEAIGKALRLRNEVAGRKRLAAMKMEDKSCN